MMKRIFLGILFAGLILSSCAKKSKELLVAPKFPSKAIWLQGKPAPANFYADKVTLIYFWDYTCLNCLRDLVYLREWERLYHAHGFQIVLIHSPEFKFAAKKENVERALSYYGISYPVILDNDFSLWKAYQVYSWPTKILINPQGRIMRTEIGEGRYLDFEKSIRAQIERMDPLVHLPDPAFSGEPYTYEDDACGSMSGDTYMGYDRANWLGASIANREWTKPEKTTVFRDRGDRVPRGFFLHGLWTNQEDAFRHARTTNELNDYLGLLYRGTQVYAVLSQDDSKKETPVYVTRNGEPVPEAFRGRDLVVDPEGKTYVPLRESRLYQLILNEEDGEHEIKLWPRSEGVSINTFSFANRCLSRVDLQTSSASS